MRGFRGGIGHFGASIGALLSGVLSFPQIGLPSFFQGQGVPSLRTPSKPRQIKRRPARVHRGWRPMFYGTAGPDSREAERRRRQIASGQLKRDNGLEA